MNITPQMTNLPAEKQAATAIRTTLQRIADSPEVAYHCGHGTQTYSLLIEAHATLNGIAIQTAQANFPPATPRPLAADELRPCPFCGGSFLEPRSHGFPDVAIHCGDCQFDGPTAETTPEARARWNRRAIQRL